MLGELAATEVLPLTLDKSERVWQAAFSALSFGLEGGGTLERIPWGNAARRAIAQAMLQAELDREVAYREWVAALLAAAADAKDLPALQAWQKKDGSKSVKKILQRGIDRLQSPPPPKPAQSKPKVASTKKKSSAKQKPVAPVAISPPADPAFLPCRFSPGEDGSTASLTFTDFAPTAEIFAEFDYDGGGYGWQGVADALVRKLAPHLKKKISYDPEASMFVAISPDASALRELATLIRTALEDETTLRQALKHANPKLMN